MWHQPYLCSCSYTNLMIQSSIGSSLKYQHYDELFCEYLDVIFLKKKIILKFSFWILFAVMIFFLKDDVFYLTYIISNFYIFGLWLKFWCVILSWQNTYLWDILKRLFLSSAIHPEGCYPERFPKSNWTIKNAAERNTWEGNGCNLWNIISN
jgi:hypothetical protein